MIFLLGQRSGLREWVLNLPVETVACEAGFEDPFYFSKLFRRRVGIPPMAFRRQRLT